MKCSAGKSFAWVLAATAFFVVVPLTSSADETPFPTSLDDIDRLAATAGRGPAVPDEMIRELVRALEVPDAVEAEIRWGRFSNYLDANWDAFGGDPVRIIREFLADPRLADGGVLIEAAGSGGGGTTCLDVRQRLRNELIAWTAGQRAACRKLIELNCSDPADQEQARCLAAATSGKKRCEDDAARELKKCLAKAGSSATLQDECNDANEKAKEKCSTASARAEKACKDARHSNSRLQYAAGELPRERRADAYLEAGDCREDVWAPQVAFLQGLDWTGSHR
jgi:hypothetical protein